jgi:hypothetical protein
MTGAQQHILLFLLKWYFAYIFPVLALNLDPPILAYQAAEIARVNPCS